jgi:hypothetical protein
VCDSQGHRRCAKREKLEISQFLAMYAHTGNTAIDETSYHEGTEV